MSKQTTRREILKGGAAMAGLGALGFPEWAFPALAQGETVMAFTDYPEGWLPERCGATIYIVLAGVTYFLRFRSDRWERIQI